MRTKKLVKILQISIFAAIATVLTFFELPVFFAPGFYKLDFSDVVVLISGFSLGPLAGILTEFLKVLLKLLIKGSTTVGLGDFAGFVAGVALTLPSIHCIAPAYMVTCELAHFAYQLPFPYIHLAAKISGHGQIGKKP